LRPPRTATKLLFMLGKSMKRFLQVLAGSSLLLGAHTIGAQPESPAVIAKHQLSECMTKRMAADKSVSYNEAMRACKERLLPPKDTLASINPSETGTKAH
jgi:hypothetical protein